MSSNRPQRRRSGSSLQDNQQWASPGSSSAGQSSTSASYDRRLNAAADQTESNQEATRRRGKLKQDEEGIEGNEVENIRWNHSAGNNQQTNRLSAAKPSQQQPQEQYFSGASSVNSRPSENDRGFGVESGSGAKISQHTSTLQPVIRSRGQSSGIERTSSSPTSTTTTSSLSTARTARGRNVPPHSSAAHGQLSTDRNPLPESLSPPSISRFDKWAQGSPSAPTFDQDGDAPGSTPRPLIPHQPPSPSGRSGIRRSRRSSQASNTASNGQQGQRRRRRSSPLRSLTPSRSEPNLAPLVSSAESHQQIPCSSSLSSLPSTTPSSSSSSSLTASHSFPFLAEPPPERPSIRQRRRLSSMPTRVSSRMKLSRSRSPPANIASKGVSSHQGVSFSSSSSSKRGREEESTLEGSRHRSAGAERQGSSSKRVASGTHSGTGTGAEEKESGKDEEDSSAAMNPNNGRRYELIVIQQPQRGCAFGSNLLSRLPCAPPLIVQLRVVDNEGNELSSDAEEPFLVCHATLLTPDGQNADLLSPVQPGQSTPSTPVAGGSGTSPSAVASQGLRRSSRRSSGAGSAMSSGSGSSGGGGGRGAATPTIQRVPSTAVRMLYGSLAATPQKFTPPPSSSQAGDDSSSDPASSSSSPSSPTQKTYFIFPEICVRAKGIFQLKLSLMKLPRPTELQGGLESSAGETGSDLLATTMTHTFEVFLAHQYTVPYVTDLTRFFARQGAALPLPSGD
ncbi:unnamed protein product [Sympodiomycopsis kandeliae]